MTTLPFLCSSFLIFFNFPLLSSLFLHVSLQITLATTILCLFPLGGRGIFAINRPSDAVNVFEITFTRTARVGTEQSGLRFNSFLLTSDQREILAVV
jgi:hypothetical protein